MEKNFFDRILNKSAHIEGCSYITHERSWGSSVVLDANTRLHFINGEPSAHFHRFRTEDYVLYSGELQVYRGEWYEGDLLRTVANLRMIKLLPGDRIVISPKIVHIPINTCPGGSVLFEISHGPYAEEDIERIYDKNARDHELVKKWSLLGYEPGNSIVNLISLIKTKQNISPEWIQSEDNVKVVSKPWGSNVVSGTESVGELWLNYRKGENIGDEDKRYAFKKLYVKAGTRLSLHYHINKLETNHIISGKAEVWFENEKGQIEKAVVAKGDTWSVPAGRKHRVVALTDIIILETSTPEIDDVIRVEDDSNRPDGRIDSEHNANAK